MKYVRDHDTSRLLELLRWTSSWLRRTRPGNAGGPRRHTWIVWSSKDGRVKRVEFISRSLPADSVAKAGKRVLSGKPGGMRRPRLNRGLSLGRRRRCFVRRDGKRVDDGGRGSGRSRGIRLLGEWCKLGALVDLVVVVDESAMRGLLDQSALLAILLLVVKVRVVAGRRSFLSSMFPGVREEGEVAELWASARCRAGFSGCFAGQVALIGPARLGVPVAALRLHIHRRRERFCVERLGRRQGGRAGHAVGASLAGRAKFLW